MTKALRSFAIIMAVLAGSRAALAQTDPEPVPAPPPPAPEATTVLVQPWVPPEGRAASATEAGSRGSSRVRVGLEVFAEYMYRRTQAPTDGSQWFHSFELPRAHGAVEGEWERARGRLVLEAVRSASEGSLVGVSGDSLVLRVREAYGSYKPIDMLEVSAGVLPTLTIPELDGTWMMRAVAPSALEANALASPADLGVKVRSELPGNHGWLAVAAYNGEGYTSRELNRGKTVEGAFEVHPLPSGALRPLGVFASYTNGSTGTVTARADRLTSGLVWQGIRVRGGAFFTYAWGLAQAGTQQAAVGTAFVRAEPLPKLLAGGKVDVVVRDVRTAPADAISTVWLTLGYRVAEPLEVYLAGSHSIPTARADAEVPGSDSWALRVIGRVVF